MTATSLGPEMQGRSNFLLHAGVDYTIIRRCRAYHWRTAIPQGLRELGGFHGIGGTAPPSCPR
jgi:hypothetical protein